MRNILSLSALSLLCSCVTTTYRDTLVRATLEGPLPRLPVHLPSKDSTLTLQGSVAITVSPKGEYDVVLKEPDKTDGNGNWGHGRTVTWNQEPLMGSGEISLLTGRHFRFSAGAQGDLRSRVAWGGIGVIFGRKTPLEIGATFGETTIDRELEGVREITMTDDCDEDSWGCIPRSETIRGADTTTWDRTEVPFSKLSVTLSRQGGGPWAEAAWTSFTKLARTIEGDWHYDASSFQIGAGWSHDTRYGRLVVGVRGETLGDSFDPSLHLQWTADLPLD